MTDKEVGELWKDAVTWLSDSHIKNQVLGLIRKLVEVEERRLKGTLRGREPGTPTDLQLALKRFGIPESDWQENP